MIPPISYLPFDHFLFRTPLFSFEYLKKEDEFLNNKEFAEAVLIASPEFHAEVSKLQKTTKEYQKGKERIIRSLYRYFQRACTRPTPFGLFAGCSVGSIYDRTSVQLAEQKHYKVSIR